MPLSIEQKKAYVRAEGAHCPYCGGSDLATGAHESDSGYVACVVDCEDCGKRWRDVYLLSTIVELEGD